MHRSITTTVIGVLLLAGYARSAQAQAPLPNDPLSRNAALSYWQAFALLPQIDDEVRKKLSLAAAGSSPVDDDLRALVRPSEAALKCLHRGAGIESCVWGIDYQSGPNAYLPHLSKARELARVALLRARIRFETGQNEAGVEDVLATVQLARHVGQEGVVVLINMLVGFAIESQAGDTAAFALSRLDQEERDEFQRRLLQIKPTFDLTKALQGEKDVFLGWLIREIEQGRSKDSVLELLSGDVDSRLANQVRNASQGELLKWAKDLGAVYDAGTSYMSLSPTEAKEQEKKLRAQIHDEEKGNPLAPSFCPLSDRHAKPRQGSSHARRY